MKEEWKYWKENPTVPVTFAVAAILLLCVVFFLPSCATREKGVMLNGQETLLLPFPDDVQQAEDAYFMRHSPIFSPIWTP